MKLKEKRSESPGHPLPFSQITRSSGWKREMTGPRAAWDAGSPE